MKDIRLIDIKKDFDDNNVLNGFTHVFKSDTINFIVGPSGIGKTTLVRILAGLETEDSGSIKGLDDKRVSMVFQDDSLCENLSIRANIKMVSEKTDDEILEDAEKLGLSEFFKTRINSLSGGMKRRVSILRAFSIPFDLMILDEPFKGLDSSLRESVMDYVIENLIGKTAVLITHSLDEVEYFKKTEGIRVEVLEITDSRD